MSDEALLETTEVPEVQPEEPQVESPPVMPWDLTPTTQEPTRSAPAYQPTGDADDDEIAQIVDLQYSDPTKAERMREARNLRKTAESATAAVQAQMMETMAPMIRTQLIGSVAQGLGAEAVKYLEGYLGNYSAAAMSNISKDPNTLKILRDAAELHDTRTRGPRTQAPRTEGAAAVAQSGLDVESERQIEVMYQAWKHLPGMTKDKIRAEILKESK